MSTDHRFRHRNKGLRKVCACHASGKHLSKDEAEALADDLRGAIRRGEYPPPPAPAPTSTPAEITFAKFGALWLERERQDRVGDWKSDRSRLARLGAISDRKRQSPPVRADPEDDGNSSTCHLRHAQGVAPAG